MQVTSDYQAAIDNATKLITGSKGGNVVINRDADGHPTEILIMDTTDVNIAKNVWRWNAGGFGYSSTGINGPYTVAITMDGQIVGSFIAALKITGEQIDGGTITGATLKTSNLSDYIIVHNQYVDLYIAGVLQMRLGIAAMSGNKYPYIAFGNTAADIMTAKTYVWYAHDDAGGHLTINTDGALNLLSDSEVAINAPDVYLVGNIYKNGSPL
ncbi:MAG: hypothetical protein QME45_10725 [Clostridiales bacterium]|nr:hypothetical protein [Clostridiales bacterium]